MPYLRLLVGVMKTREDFISWAAVYVRFNRYDLKFINGILRQRIYRGQAITTGQAELLDKLIVKYRKQLSDQLVNATDILALPWDLPPVPKTPDNDKYQLQIDNDTLICKFPFNETLVQKVQQLRNKNGIKAHWNRNQLQWELPMTLPNFKGWYDLTVESGFLFEYCAHIQQLLDTINSYGDASHWQCRLVRLPSGYCVINNISETLLEHLPEFTYNLDEKTVDQLTELGIFVDVNQLPLNIQQRPVLAQLLTNQVVVISRESVDNCALADIDHYASKLLDGQCTIDTAIADVIKTSETMVDSKAAVSLVSKWSRVKRENASLRVAAGSKEWSRISDFPPITHLRRCKKVVLVTPND